MDDIRFSCPSCDRHLAAAPDLAGEPMSCPACGHALVIPPLAREPPPPSCAAIPAPRSIPTLHSPKPDVVFPDPGRRPAVVTAAPEHQPSKGRTPTAAVAIAAALLVMSALVYVWRVRWNAAPVCGSAGRVAGLSFPLIWVGGGTFERGSSAGDADEQPAHAVRISQGFWMGGAEVCNGDYQLFLRASAYNGRADADGDYLRHVSGRSEMSSNPQHPVVWVSWSNAVAFCHWLTRRERKAGRLPEYYVYRLPTEAEWEWAARGGSAQPGSRYSGAEDADAVAWYRDNSQGGTQPAGAKAPNELGLRDMSGNVWEWCLDWYQNDYTGLPETDPAGPGQGQFRVLRGGGWNGEASLCRTTCRGRMQPSCTTSFLGFRVALAPARQVK
jgi:formylglycine-generating enzyme required for sulfatase activity